MTNTTTAPVGAHTLSTKLGTYQHHDTLRALGLKYTPNQDGSKGGLWHTDDQAAYAQAHLVVTGVLPGDVAQGKNKTMGGAGDGIGDPTLAGGPTEDDGTEPEGDVDPTGEHEGTQGTPDEAAQKPAEGDYESPEMQAAATKRLGELTDRECNAVLSFLKTKTGIGSGDYGRDYKPGGKFNSIQADGQGQGPGGMKTPVEAKRERIAQICFAAMIALAMILAEALGQEGEGKDGQAQAKQQAALPGGKPSQGQGQAQAPSQSQQAKQQEARQKAAQTFGKAGIESIEALAAAQLDEDRVREIAREEDERVLQAASTMGQALADAISQVDAKVQDAAFQAVQAIGSGAPVQVRVTIADGPEVDATGMHRLATKIAALLRAGLNVALVGPPGVGKTHVAEDVAKLLGWRFGGAMSVTAGINESQIMGRLIPIGNGYYLPAPFVTAYENGGVFLADEFDAADPNTRLAFNQALANTGFYVEARTINPDLSPYIAKHATFGFLCGMNTWGTGATAQFAGRMKQDDASNDRLYPVFMGIDASIVGHIFGVAPVKSRVLPVWKPATQQDEPFNTQERLAWQNWFWAVTDALEKVNSTKTWSPRAGQKIIGARSVGVPRAEVLADLFAGWKPDALAHLGNLQAGPAFK